MTTSRSAKIPGGDLTIEKLEETMQTFRDLMPDTFEINVARGCLEMLKEALGSREIREALLHSWLAPPLPPVSRVPLFAPMPAIHEVEWLAHGFAAVVNTARNPRCKPADRLSIVDLRPKTKDDKASSSTGGL